jgi:hypothetical protein
MSYYDAINNAIGAHSEWKLRLRQAIDTGRSEWTVDRVSPDNLCAFGKWLYSLPEADRLGESWKTVRVLHADFHKEAGKVLDLALRGAKDDARKLMAFGSPYAKVSAKLIWEMMEWKKRYT